MQTRGGLKVGVAVSVVYYVSQSSRKNGIENILSHRIMNTSKELVKKIKNKNAPLSS